MVDGSCEGLVGNPASSVVVVAVVGGILLHHWNCVDHNYHKDFPPPLHQKFEDNPPHHHHLVRRILVPFLGDLLRLLGLGRRGGGREVEGSRRGSEGGRGRDTSALGVGSGKASSGVGGMGTAARAGVH